MFTFILLDGFSESFTSALVVLIVFLLIVLVLRGLTLWYFAIGERVDNQKKQIKLLEKIVEKLDANEENETKEDSK